MRDIGQIVAGGHASGGSVPCTRQLAGCSVLVAPRTVPAYLHQPRHRCCIAKHQCAGVFSAVVLWCFQLYLHPCTTLPSSTIKCWGVQVPDVFQIIVKEKGVFTNVISPSTKAKLRLLFEVAPLAFLVSLGSVAYYSCCSSCCPSPE